MPNPSSAALRAAKAIVDTSYLVGDSWIDLFAGIIDREWAAERDEREPCHICGGMACLDICSAQHFPTKAAIVSQTRAEQISSAIAALQAHRRERLARLAERVEDGEA